MPDPRMDSREDPELLDEAALVQRLAAYDPEAWQTVFDRYFQSIYRQALVRTFQRSVAEDIAAEVFAEAARGIGRYRYRGVPFRAWLFRIGRNLIADHLKARSRAQHLAIDDFSETLATATEDIELRIDFMQALQGLTEEQKTVVTLRLIEGCNLEEVAAVLRKSTGAVKQLQRRAFAALRERMSQRGLVGS